MHIHPNEFIRSILLKIGALFGPLLTKNALQDILQGISAEEEGFEPPVRCRTTVFKTAAIDHSAIPPERDCKGMDFLLF